MQQSLPISLGPRTVHTDNYLTSDNIWQTFTARGIGYFLKRIIATHYVGYSRDNNHVRIDVYGPIYMGIRRGRYLLFEFRQEAIIHTDVAHGRRGTKVQRKTLRNVLRYTYECLQRSKNLLTIILVFQKRKKSYTAFHFFRLDPTSSTVHNLFCTSTTVPFVRLSRFIQPPLTTAYRFVVAV